MRVQRMRQVAVMAGMFAVMAMAAAIPAQAQTAAEMRDATNAEIQAQMATVMVPLQAKMLAQEAQMQAKSVEMTAPILEAKIEAQMVPLQAEMMARSTALQAQMLARSAMMQAELTTVGDPQVKDDLFAGTEKFAKGASDVTDVNLDPSMMGMVGGKHGDLAHKLNFMVVRSYEYPEKGMYNMADVDAYRQKLKSGNWNCFVHTYESKTGESTDICNRALPNNQGNEMVIMTVEPKELTFIHLSGNASMEDLGKLGAMGGHMVPDMPERPEKPEKPERPEKPEAQ